VVSNSTPLIFLAKIGRLDLLEKIFDAVIIPDKVFSEVVIEGKEKGYSDAFIVEKFIDNGIISKKDVKIKYLNDMPIGKGELEAIELAVKMGIQDILIDEAKGRRIARLYDLQPKGTLWVLTKAFENDFLSQEELKNSITELIRCGYRIKEDILVDILKELM
jgi:predicted nucleic acid-binding protein